MLLSTRTESALRTDIRSELVFVLWVVLLGPAAYVAALAKEFGRGASGAFLLHHYGTALLHFLTFSVVLGSALVWYRHRQRSRPEGTRRRWGRVAFAAVAAALLAAWCAIGTERFLAAARHVLDDAIIAAVVLVVERLYRQLVTSRMEAEHQELCRERERRAAAEVRWSSLESRVRPHFLFNTLSSIRELVYRDVEQAGTMIQRFADLLRSSLESERCSVVPLRDEVRIVTGYLEIERMRLGARLRWSLEIEPASLECPVPALSVLTLVENSLKHAIAPRREGGSVAVKAGLHDGVLVIEAADDGPGFGGGAIVAGHGLDLLARRLETWGGGELLIRNGGPGATVTLKLPVRAPEPARVALEQPPAVEHRG